MAPFFFPILGNQKTFAKFVERQLPHMEETEQEIAERPAQIFDFGTGQMVDNPALKQEKKEGETSEEGEESEESSTENQEESSGEESTEGEEGTEEEKDESDDNGEEKEENEEDVLDEDTYVSTVYGEKFGIKSKEELETLVTNAAELQDEYETLKKENETLKAEGGKPKFDSDKEEKAFEFIKKFDINRQGEALDTYAKLISMDVDTSDPMMVLEEKFIHEHPEWSRAEAQRMFSKDYNRRFTLDKNRFEGTEEEYKIELADLEIAKKGEVARARNYLKDQQTKYKPQAAEVKPAVSEVFTVTNSASNPRKN